MRGAWRWVLAISVGLNIVGGAAVATKLARDQLAPAAAERGRVIGGWRARMADLPAADREVLRAALRADGPGLAASGRRQREAMEAVRTALVREPFDQAGLTSAVEALARARAENAALALRRLAAAAPALSAEARRQLAAAALGGGR